MPLRAPVLGRRSYDELLRELLARIPVHRPDWTDFNVSDPGVTLLELLAFLLEELDARAREKRRRRRALALAALSSVVLVAWWRRRAEDE